MQPNQPPSLSSMASAAKAPVDKQQNSVDPLDIVNYIPLGLQAGGYIQPPKYDGNDNNKNIRADIDVNMADEATVIPPSSCLMVEKMHVYSVHHAILDFHGEVYLTDVIFPPCKSLASVTLIAWDGDDEDGVVLAFTDEINKNALVISNLVSPIKLRYIKVVVVGGDSCSVVIPLGQYFGYHKGDSRENRQVMLNHYSDLFCRFSLALDRLKPISNRIQFTTLKSSTSNKNANLVVGNTKKDYALASHLQLSMNYLRNQLWPGHSPDTVDDSSGDSFSSQQLLLSYILRLILCYQQTPRKFMENLEQKELLNKSDFLALFEQICMYGVPSIYDNAVSALHNLCSDCSWWEDGLIEVYERCFTYNSTIPIPPKRIFNIITKLMKSSKGLNVIISKLLELLNEQLRKSITQFTIKSPSNLDWLLSSLDFLLDSKDFTLWDFFNAWDSNHKNKTTATVQDSSATAQTPNNNECPLMEENYPLQRPTSSPQSSSTSSGEQPSSSLSSPDTSKEISGDVFLEQTICTRSLNLLMEFILSKLEIGNQDQLILCCKVCSLIVYRCQGVLHLEDFINQETLKTLLTYCLRNQRKWVSYSINLLLKSIVCQKDESLKELGCVNTARGSETNLYGVAGESKDRRQGAMADHSNKMNQLKMLKEKAMHKTFFEATDGKYIGQSAGEKLQDIATSDKENDLNIVPTQCFVSHPKLHHFNKILEENVTPLQTKLWQHKPPEFQASPLQKIWVPSCEEFKNQVKSLKEKALSNIIHCFGEILKQREYIVSVQCVEELLYLLNLVHESDIELSLENGAALCEQVILLFHKLGRDIKPCLKSTLDRLVQTLLKDPLIWLSFSTQFLNLGNLNATSPDFNFDEIQLTTLKTMTKTSKPIDERLVKKELLLNMNFQRVDSRTLIETLELLASRSFLSSNQGTWFDFFSSSEGHELEVTRKLAHKLAIYVETFIKDNATLLHAGNVNRSDTKRTIYLLHNGRCRLGGKAHVASEDVNLVTSLLKILENLLQNELLEERNHGNDTMVCESLEKLIRAFVYSEKLTVNQDVSHPLSTAILNTLIEIGKKSNNSILVHSTINVLKDIMGNGSNELQYSGIKQFLIDLLTQNQTAWKQFQSKGGFELLLSYIIDHGKQNLSWVDTSKNSPVLLILQSSSNSSVPLNAKTAFDKDKARRDQDGEQLENFAPHAKIISPSSSPGADVLLGNKSPLRRSRFPAWGHHFQEQDDCWIHLDIVFPFEIMLKEVVIHMHGNYLIGTPSSVIVEIKSLSDFITMSPALITGGLQSIVLHFADKCICKELRLKLCRPNGGDHIKLNLIELFGKPFFSADAFPFSPIYHTKVLPIEPHIVLLTQMLTCNEEMIEDFVKHEFFNKAMSAILKQMPFLSRNTLQKVSSFIINRIISPRLPNFPISLINTLRDHIFSADRVLLYQSTQIILIIKFIADVITAVPKNVQENVYCYLFGGFYFFLRQVNLDDTYILNNIQATVGKIFKLLKNLDVSLQQCQCKNDLLSYLQELLTKDSHRLHISVFASLGQLLNILIPYDTTKAIQLHTKTSQWIQELKTNQISNSHSDKAQNEINVCLATLYCCTSQTRERSFELLDDLSGAVCIMVGDQTKIHNLLIVLNIFRGLFWIDCHELREWFLTDNGQKFWKPLLSWLVEYGNTQQGSKSLTMYQTLKVSVLLFQKIVHLNPPLQQTFCTILLEVLEENNRRTNYMSGYLKYILHQLVVIDETVTFTFKMRTTTYMLQSSHQIQLRLSYSVSDIVQTILKFRNSVFASSAGLDDTNEKSLSGKPDFSSDAVMASANVAAAKRRLGRLRNEAKQNSTKTNRSQAPEPNLNVDFYLPEISDNALPSDMKIGQVLQLLYEKGQLTASPVLYYNISAIPDKEPTESADTRKLLDQKPMLTLLERFALDGGLPLVMPSQGLVSTSPSSNYINLFAKILPLPGYAQVFLKDRAKAELLLRLMLGVKETKLGQQINTLVIAQDLSTLPLTSLRDLLQQSSILSQQGYHLRKLAFERNVVKFVIEKLRALYFHNENKDSKEKNQATNPDSSFWAKGTGFGTGSTVSNWDIEKAMKRKKKEEKDMVVILQVLTALVSKSIRPTTDEEENEGNDTTTSQEDLNKMMSAFGEALSASNVMDVLSAYLHNDSVLDMSRHIPLYHTILAILRPLADHKSTLLLIIEKKSESRSIVTLLIKLKKCVEMYNSRLKATTKLEAQKFAEKTLDDNGQPSSSSFLSRLKINGNGNGSRKEADSFSQRSEAKMEDLSGLLSDIETTTDFVLQKVEEYEKELAANRGEDVDSHTTLQAVGNVDDTVDQAVSAEESYVQEMMELQFDSYELITEKDDSTLQFNVPYHYANLVREARRKDVDVFNINRARRLAQEVASLSTSLPISYSSTVFLRCDEQRLDVMKVLITGPEGTPYENGCFEFDVYIPPEYPSSPMSVNLQTTGKHTVRFNPNLYNDGKVCLSILNTWHGRPEEKWNEKTSNLLQVLVSIQSLILVSDPYFNEPGYERLRGTAQGQQSSTDYNSNIRPACVKWAILEQIKRPSSCFKEVIHKHFIHKKDKVLTQCQTWLSELKELGSKRRTLYEAMKAHVTELKTELDKLQTSHGEDNTKDKPTEVGDIECTASTVL